MPHFKPEIHPALIRCATAAVMIRDRKLFAVAFLCLLGLGSILAILYYLTQSHLKQSLVEAAGHYSELVAEFRTLYTSEVVARVLPEGIEVTHDYKSRNGTIPLPATLSMLLGRRVGVISSGAKMRLFSDYPFPWRTDGGPQDAFEIDALMQLRRDPKRPYFRFEKIAGELILRYATADIMRPSCVGCHNSHRDSPKRDWRAGDVRGVLAVTLPAVTNASGKLSGVNLAFGMAAIVFILGTVLVSMVIARQHRAAAVVAQHAVDLRREVRNRERTAEQLRRSNDDLIQFAHIASHDLAEPARKVMAFGDLLAEESGDTLDDDGKHYLEKMIDASKRMRTLIDDLLEYSRVSSNAIIFTDLDLKHIANQAQSDLSEIILETSGRIEIEEMACIKAN